MATAYSKRPSDFIMLETEMAAWQLDEACLMIGRQVEKNMHEGKDAFSGFGDSGLLGAIKRGYRSAKALVKKTVRIRPDGTW
jgi:hypothetical protein